MKYLFNLCAAFLFLLYFHRIKAQQVKNLSPNVPYNCCPSNFYRSHPVSYCYEGREKNIIHIWETVQLLLNLESDDFEHFVGGSPNEVQSQFEKRQSSWSFNFVNTKRNVISLNPFNKTCVGIVTKADYTVELVRIRADYWKILMAVSGIALFFSAPKLSNNSLFYYLCGVSFGTCASVLVLVFILSRLLPKKPMMYSFLISGWTVGLYLVQFLWENIKTIAMDYQTYVVYYLIVTACISFMVCYRLGPVSDPRSINLITWIMQGFGMLLILFSSHFKEATLALDIILFTIYIVPFNNIFRFLSKIWRKLFKGKPVRVLLTEDEYNQIGARETTKALEELRGYCSSPECNQWRTVLKLHDPLRYPEFANEDSHRPDFQKRKINRRVDTRLLKRYKEFISEDSRRYNFQRRKINRRVDTRFAQFVEGGSHLEDNEVLAFETDMKDNDLYSSDNSSDSSLTD